MTEDSTLGLPVEADSPGQASSPETQRVTRIFLVALGALLLGYMFLGRGFAHIGIGPIYIGDWILLLGIATTAFVTIRAGVRAPLTWTVALLFAFVALGAARTVPYLGTYGLEALRDGVLWGYAGFAFIVYLLADRWLLRGAFRAYGWVVPIFALWLPISWNLFAAASANIDPSKPGSFVPLVFFKGGDMAVHTVGAIAFLVLGASAAWSARTFLWRVVIAVPLLWTAFVAGTSNRGALVTAAVGIIVIAVLARRSRNWLPFLAAIGVLAVAGIFEAVLAQTIAPTPSPSPAQTVAPTPPPGRSPGAYSLVVNNAGFELGTVNEDTIAGWTIHGSGSHRVVQGGAYRGARFASMQNVGKAYGDTISSSMFAFKGGPDIAVSAWVKAMVGQPILEIYVTWYDRSGSLISSRFVSAQATHGVGIWQQCAGAVVAPANATTAELTLFETSGNAVIGIDEVTVRSGDYVPEQVPPKGRPATLQQMIENVLSIFGPTSDGGLEGSKQFRLAWWGKIVQYTVFGKYFWTGKGFGVNLADADGFQSNLDDSLRSPHNTEMTVLARMGVPGLLLWVALQSAFIVGLVRAIVAHRRARDQRIAIVAGLILAYWIAMMIDTSFDPYLEGPQGGIWFWVIFGLGLAVTRLVPRRHLAS